MKKISKKKLGKKKSANLKLNKKKLRNRRIARVKKNPIKKLKSRNARKQSITLKATSDSALTYMASRVTKKISRSKNTKSSQFLRFAIHTIFIFLSVFFIKNTELQTLLNGNELVKPSSLVDINISRPKDIKYLADAPSEILIPTLDIQTKISTSLIDEDAEGFELTAIFDKNLNTLGQERSHTLIYAHARKDLFGNLPYISTLDRIYVVGEANKLYVYDVTEVETISPLDVDKVESVGEKNLSIFTCQGDDDQYRFLVNAKLVEDYNVEHKEVI